MREPPSVESIFSAAVQKDSAEERAAFLHDACGGNDDLRRQVERLLNAVPKIGSFMEKPLAPTEDEPDVDSAKAAATLPPRPIREGPGTRIGPYKLLQQIGEGGMGVVYMAEQEQPIRRRVALKIIKPGMDSALVIARFEAERQALAMMDYLNIARVFDAGTTESGRPYFVMELVHGVPITDYCDENKLPLKERLELFVPVCRAMQHAHQKGIIHRDVKPSNVLITLYDGKPVPKVIDFGVAKAIEQKLTERTMFTQYGAIVGTLEYMAPEQAEMSGLGVDTRSDIYSLGVLLYELLTGTTPVEQKTVRELTYLQLLRMIQEDEPPKPSARLSTTQQLASIAAHRRTAPRDLAKVVRGELDWIVMKALEKDRTRRYESASGLARDVERYLHDEPVEAGPPSAQYRLRKFARRYRRGLRLAAAFALLVMAGAAFSAWEAFRARRAELAAVQDRDRAVTAEEAGRHEQQRALAAEAAAVTAKERTQDVLAASLYDQARSVRLSGLPGRRWRALELLKESEQLRIRKRAAGSTTPAGTEQTAVPHDVRSQSQLRTEALASLSLDDAHVVRQWEGFSHSVSPDGTLAVRVFFYTAHGTAGLAITDLKTGAEKSKWEGKDATQLLGMASVIALGPNARRLVIGARAGSFQTSSIDVLDLPERKLLRKLLLPQRPRGAPEAKTPDLKPGAFPYLIAGESVVSLRFSPNGRYLCGVTRSISKPLIGDRVVVWDLEGDAAGHTVGNLKGVPIADFSPDSRLLAFASTSGKVVLWNVARNQLEKEFELSLDPCGAVGFAPDGKLVIACAKSNEKPGSRTSGTSVLLVWDITRNRETKRIGPVPSAPNGISVSPDGTRVAMSHGSVGNILVVELASEKPAIPVNHQQEPQLLAWTGDGVHLLSGAHGWLKLWQFADDSPCSDLQMEANSSAGFTGAVACSPTSSLIAVESAGKSRVELYDSATRKLVRHLQSGRSDKFSQIRLAFSPDGKQLASMGSFDLVVWDVDAGTQRLRIDQQPSLQRMITSVGFRDDGSALLGEQHNFLPVVSEADSGKSIWQGWMLLASPALVSPDGRFATTSMSISTVLEQPAPLIDLSTAKIRYRFPLPPKGSNVSTIREFSPNGRWLLAIHMDVITLGGFRVGTPSIGGAPSGFLGSGMAQQPWTGDVFDVESGKRHMEIRGVSNPLTRAFSPDGRYLAVSMESGAIRVWDTEAREELFDWYPFGDHPEEFHAPQYFAFTGADASLVVPIPDNSGFRMLNLARVNEGLRTAALNW
jgi:serine/threonine protein kinase/WD40 repeat protein